jgi:hypothetical protein
MLSGYSSNNAWLSTLTIGKSCDPSMLTLKDPSLAVRGDLPSSWGFSCCSTESRVGRGRTVNALASYFASNVFPHKCKKPRPRCPQQPEAGFFHNTGSVGRRYHQIALSIGKHGQESGNLWRRREQASRQIPSEKGGRFQTSGSNMIGHVFDISWLLLGQQTLDMPSCQGWAEV